jgi:hypothetical protein
MGTYYYFNNIYLLFFFIEKKNIIPEHAIHKNTPKSNETQVGAFKLQSAHSKFSSLFKIRLNIFSCFYSSNRWPDILIFLFFFFFFVFFCFNGIYFFFFLIFKD